MGSTHLIMGGTAEAQSFHAKKEGDRVDFTQNGQLITSYHFRSGSKPILWPLIGPGGVRMSREYPMQLNSENEEHDHVHHRSLWMTFGEVNDVDFWAEGKGKGEIVHSQLLVTQASDSDASLEAKHIWKRVSDDGTNDSALPILEEHCRYTVSGTPEERMIDCEYVLRHAPTAEKKAIHFGDTKEGMFAIRVPESMRADKAGGQILNSAGQQNADAWGRTADWVDYSGKATPDSKETVGIAIFIHPTSFGRNGYWHVRTYGLFAHNPIGVKHFLEGRPDETPTHPAGGVMLEPNQSMHLFYRVIFHRGSWDSQQAAQRFAQFSSTPRHLE